MLSAYIGYLQSFHPRLVNTGQGMGIFVYLHICISTNASEVCPVCYMSPPQSSCWDLIAKLTMDVFFFSIQTLSFLDFWIFRQALGWERGTHLPIFAQSCSILFWELS